MGYIYKITNTVNGKAYIGQTIQKLENRIKHHLNGNSGSVILKRAIDKYGCNAFTIEVLHEVLDFALDDLEKEEIKRCNTLSPDGYNLESGGNTHKKPSLETRKKMSEAKKGQKPSLETRKKMSKARKGNTNAKGNTSMLGKKHSAEARRKMSEAQRKRFSKPEERQKLSEAHKGKKLSAEHRQKLSRRTHSPETRKKMSESHKKRIQKSLC